VREKQYQNWIWDLNQICVKSNLISILQELEVENVFDLLPGLIKAHLHLKLEVEAGDIVGSPTATAMVAMATTSEGLWCLFRCTGRGGGGATASSGTGSF